MKQVVNSPTAFHNDKSLMVPDSDLVVVTSLDTAEYCAGVAALHQAALLKQIPLNEKQKSS